MVVIGPSQSQTVLTSFLNSGRPVSPLPIIAFGRKKQIAGPVDAKIRDRGTDQSGRQLKTGMVICVITLSQFEGFEMVDRCKTQITV